MDKNFIVVTMQMLLNYGILQALENLVNIFVEHRSSVKCIVLSDCAKTLLPVSLDNSIKVWSATKFRHFKLIKKYY